LTYDTYNQPVVLVTGASSGIGLALARKLWRSNYRVVVTARTSSLVRFEDEPFCDNARFLIRPLDVTSSPERQVLIAEMQTHWGGIDLLINNAGIGYRSVIEHTSEADRLMVLETNYLGPMALIQLVLPSMRHKRSGRIINVSSVSGMMAMPTMGSYSASKFALEGATEALWYEVRPWNIKVSLVEPGFVHSNSFQNVYWSEQAKQSVTNGDDYAHYYEHMTTFVERLMQGAFATPESIADIILKTMAAKDPRLRIPATIDANFFAVLRRLLPRRVYHWVLYRSLPWRREWNAK
jgi:short-subunit dehydrogenase